MMFYIFYFFNVFVTVHGEIPIFLPNLPAGKYRPELVALYPCNSTKNHKLAFNVHFSKKSFNVTEATGNVTYKVPYDDSVMLDFNVAIMSSTGGWKNNAYIFKSDKACSKTLFFLGKGFHVAAKAFNMNTTNCPIPAGVYVSSGLNMKDMLENHNFPKECFYGKYKATLAFTNIKKEFLGCLVIEMNIVRPWE